jgi:hypothetical protein
MKGCFRALCLLIVTIQSAHAGDVDGRWQLSIEGEDRLEFGSEMLAGGIRLSWVTVLDFTIENGLFVLGSGVANLHPAIESYSRPEKLFACHDVEGVFASRSGQSFHTPHLRYQSFPVVGRVENGSVQLNPRLDYPGNYYAVLYECTTTSAQGEWWIERSPRIARELGKRQNAQVKREHDTFSANIKEVKTIEPGPDLDLPLIDGLTFSISQDFGLRRMTYHLHRLDKSGSKD